MSFRQDDDAKRDTSDLSSEMRERLLQHQVYSENSLKLLLKYPQFAPDLIKGMMRLKKEGFFKDGVDLRAFLVSDYSTYFAKCSPHIDTFVFGIVRLNQTDLLNDDNKNFLAERPKYADLMARTIFQNCEPDYEPTLEYSIKKNLIATYDNVDISISKLDTAGISGDVYRDLIIEQAITDEIILIMLELNKAHLLDAEKNNVKQLIRHKDGASIVLVLRELNKVPGLLNQATFDTLIQNRKYINSFYPALKSIPLNKLNQAAFEKIIAKIDISHFTLERELKRNESVGTFTHATNKAKKTIPESFRNQPEADLPQKYKNQWYVKEIKENILAAQIEVSAQELFRLFIPGQPKTRLLRDKNNNVFVASKEIEGLQPFPRDQQFNNAVTQGSILGLGELAVIAMLMNEIDFKFGSLALDNHNRAFKFDGNQCFARLQGWRASSITVKDIEALPLLDQYNPHNWLDMMYQGALIPDSIYTKANTNVLTNFHAEANLALLKVALIPDSLVEKLISSIIDDPRQNIIYDEFIKRRDQMVSAAFQNQRFLAYLNSPQAESHIRDYIDYLSTFKTVGSNFIYENPDQAKVEIFRKFETLRTSEFKTDMTMSSKAPESTKIAQHAARASFSTSFDLLRDNLTTYSPEADASLLKTLADQTQSMLSPSDLAAANISGLGRK